MQDRPYRVAGVGGRASLGWLATVLDLKIFGGENDERDRVWRAAVGLGRVYRRGCDRIAGGGRRSGVVLHLAAPPCGHGTEAGGAGAEERGAAGEARCDQCAFACGLGDAGTERWHDAAAD